MDSVSLCMIISLSCFFSIPLSLSEFWLRKFRFKVRFLHFFCFRHWKHTQTLSLSLVTTSDFSGIACVNFLVVVPVVFVLFF